MAKEHGVEESFPREGNPDGLHGGSRIVTFWEGMIDSCTTKGRTRTKPGFVRYPRHANPSFGH